MTLKLLRLSRPLAALAVGGFVAACASTGPTDDPVERKFSWLSYLQGGDFRETCAPGAPSQYRMVYNGVYTEQVRAYDLSGDGTLSWQVFGSADLTTMKINTFKDVFDPWRGVRTTMDLAQNDVDAIVSALDQDGAFGPPNVGLELSSKGFFWTMAACHDGRYHFTAWRWPSDDWDGLRFDDVLLTHDILDIALNPPRKTDTARTYMRGAQNDVGDRVENAFWTKVGENGLVGVSQFKW